MGLPRAIPMTLNNYEGEVGVTIQERTQPESLRGSETGIETPFSSWHNGALRAVLLSASSVLLKMYSLDLVTRRHQTNSERGTGNKVAVLYSSKLSRS